MKSMLCFMMMILMRSRRILNVFIRSYYHVGLFSTLFFFPHVSTDLVCIKYTCEPSWAQAAISHTTMPAYNTLLVSFVLASSNPFTCQFLLYAFLQPLISLPGMCIHSSDAFIIFYEIIILSPIKLSEMLFMFELLKCA